LGERLLCKQEVAGSIPAGSIGELPAKAILLLRPHLVGLGYGRRFGPFGAFSAPRRLADN
jgi:hypothetical protein